MLTLPEIVERAAQPYAYITFQVRMDQMQQPATEGFPAIFALLGQQGITPTGAPFYNYRRIDMATTLEVEAGVPVAHEGQGAERIKFGVLPAGRFVGLDWHGHPDKLEPVTAVLIGWTRLMQLPFDMEKRADGDHFACRLEIYETDPDDEPDMDKWVTRLAFKLRD
jgi:effector-binding domain-containing protein